MEQRGGEERLPERRKGELNERRRKKEKNLRLSSSSSSSCRLPPEVLGPLETITYSSSCSSSSPPSGPVPGLQVPAAPPEGGPGPSPPLAAAPLRSRVPADLHGGDAHLHR